MFSNFFIPVFFLRWCFSEEEHHLFHLVALNDFSNTFFINSADSDKSTNCSASSKEVVKYRPPNNQLLDISSQTKSTIKSIVPLRDTPGRIRGTELMLLSTLKEFTFKENLISFVWVFLKFLISWILVVFTLKFSLWSGIHYKLSLLFALYTAGLCALFISKN